MSEQVKIDDNIRDFARAVAVVLVRLAKERTIEKSQKDLQQEHKRGAKDKR